jgi:hypothetical protein
MEKESPVRQYQINFKRMMAAILVVLIIAAVHIFRVGSYLSGLLFVLYYSFFSDIVIPIAIYFLLCMNDATLPILESWKTKAALVFSIAATTEIAQAFGIPLLGNTFDILDFVMFAVGTSIAVGLDKAFSRVLPFWSFEDESLHIYSSYE